MSVQLAGQFQGLYVMNGQQVRPSRIFISNLLTANEDGPAATNLHMKRQLLLSLAAILFSLPTMARELSSSSIIYTVLDEQNHTCETRPAFGYGAGNMAASGSITIPEQVRDGSGTWFTVIAIGQGGFMERPITSVSISNSVIYIKGAAFADCKNLKTVRLGNSVEELMGSAFDGCTNLTTINIPNSIKTIGNSVFKDCSSLMSIELPESITKIGDYAFDGCLNLSQINLTNSITSINKYTFRNCSNLTDFEIPPTIIQIGDNAFEGCVKITKLQLPSSVNQLGANAFKSCSNLTYIASYAITPPVCNPNTNYEPFDSIIYANTTLYVPNESIEAYKLSAGWNKFANIKGFKSEDTIDDNSLTYIFDITTHTAVVTFAEENSLANYEGMQSVIVPETVEYDGETYTVTGIGDEAFNNCWGLKAVSLPSTLQSIGKLAFGYCTSLRSVTIPEEVTIVDNEAFTGCSALASVTIGGSVETIGDYAFFGCTGLASLHVPESVKTIGENAFMGIHWINEVHAKASEPAEAPVSAFSTNAYRNATLVVPDGSVDSYKAHPTWSNFLEIRENSDIPTKIEVVDGAIVVKGSDNVRVYNASGAQVYSGAAGRIELPGGIYLVATDSMSKKVRL